MMGGRRKKATMCVSGSPSSGREEATAGVFFGRPSSASQKETLFPTMTGFDFFLSQYLRLGQGHAGWLVGEVEDR